MKKNKKGGDFLVSPTSYLEVFTTKDFNEEQLMIKQSTVEFVEKEIMPFRERFEKNDYAFTEDMMRKIGELGLLGVSIPEEYGGLGMSFTTTMLVCDYLSGSNGSLSTAFGAHTGIGTLPILFYGSEKLKKEFLPGLACGEFFGCYCLTEPGAGSDANSGKTKAVLSKDGTHYKISGQKMWISNAGFAEVFTLFARIEDDKYITGFVLKYDKDNPNGISFGEEEHKLGIRSSSTRQVFFNNTKVPVENILGERGLGFKIAVNTLNVGRIKLAVACLEAQRRSINFSVQYANERIQFNQKISNFGAIQYKIAEMATRCFVGEAGCYRAAKDIEDAIKINIDSGLSHSQAELLAVEEFAIECSIMKVFCSESMNICADEGIQILGGMGYSEETPLESSYRDSRISRIYEGTNEINRLLIVGMLLKKAFKGRLDLIGPAKAVAKELTSVPSFEINKESGTLKEEMKMVENLKKVVLMIAGKAVETLGDKINNHQQIVTNISNIIIDIYTTESAVLVAQKHSAKETSSIEVEMAKLQLYNAVQSSISQATEAIISFTTGDEQRLLLMGLKRFTKFKNYPNIAILRRSIAQKIIDKNKYSF